MTTRRKLSYDEWRELFYTAKALKLNEYTEKELNLYVYDDVSSKKAIKIKDKALDDVIAINNYLKQAVLDKDKAGLINSLLGTREDIVIRMNGQLIAYNLSLNTGGDE